MNPTSREFWVKYLGKELKKALSRSKSPFLVPRPIEVYFPELIEHLKTTESCPKPPCPDCLDEGCEAWKDKFGSVRGCSRCGKITDLPEESPCEHCNGLGLVLNDLLNGYEKFPCQVCCPEETEPDGMEETGLCWVCGEWGIGPCECPRGKYGCTVKTFYLLL